MNRDVQIRRGATIRGLGKGENGRPLNPFADACRLMILQAHESGAEVKVLLRSVVDFEFIGQVLLVAADHFELFHSGRSIGMRWTLPFDDVAACSLVTQLPEDTWHIPSIHY